MLLKHRPLLLLLVLAAWLRIDRIADLPALEIDGAEYCRMAESLADGDSLHGMIPGPATMLPPGYPLLIATVMPLCGDDSVLAARVVSLLASLLTIVLAWVLMLRVIGRTEAIATCAGLAFAPLFVYGGSSAFAESLQLCCLLGALLAWQRLVQTGTVRTAMLCGACCGYAALTRIESLSVAGVAVVGLLFTTAPWNQRLRSAALCAATCGVFLLPWMLHLHAATGEWRLEVKSERVAATVERFARGLSYAEANYALDEAGRPLGPWLRPDRFDSEVRTPGRGLLAVFLDQPGAVSGWWQHNAGRLGLWLISGYLLSSALLIAAAVAGWFELSASPLRMLLVVSGLASLALGCLYKPVVRYSAVAALILWLFAGAGLTRWMRRTLHPLGWTLFMVLVCVLSVSGGVLTGSTEFAEARDTSARDAAATLPMEEIPPGLLLCTDARIPFAVGRDWLPLPAAPGAEALAHHAHECGAAALLWRSGSAERPGPMADDAALTLTGYAEHARAPAGWRLFVRRP